MFITNHRSLKVPAGVHPAAGHAGIMLLNLPHPQYCRVSCACVYQRLYTSADKVFHLIMKN